jgi:hypothetical protein
MNKLLGPLFFGLKRKREKQRKQHHRLLADQRGILSLWIFVYVNLL